MKNNKGTSASNPDPYEDLIRLDKLDPYEDLIKLIPNLQNLGINVVQFNKNEYPEYGEIIYMNWMRKLPEYEIQIAKRYNRNIYYAKNIFMFPY